MSVKFAAGSQDGACHRSFHSPVWEASTPHHLYHLLTHNIRGTSPKRCKSGFALTCIQFVGISIFCSNSHDPFHSCTQLQCTGSFPGAATDTFLTICDTYCFPSCGYLHLALVPLIGNLSYFVLFGFGTLSDSFGLGACTRSRRLPS